VPLPTLVNPKEVAEPMVITPVYAAGDVPSFPTVKVKVPEVLLVMVPVPVKEPTASLFPSISSVPPPITRAAVDEEPPSTLAAVVCTVPALIVMAPV